jgi:Cu/Ag efflux pump CusA
MLFLFRNVLVALIILFVSVLGLSGDLLLYLTNTPFKCRKLQDYYDGRNHWRKRHLHVSAIPRKFSAKTKEEAIIYAISTRLRPKLMTALGAIIALMPLALGIGTGAQMHQPLAIAVMIYRCIATFTHRSANIAQQNQFKTRRNKQSINIKSFQKLKVQNFF